MMLLAAELARGWVGVMMLAARLAQGLAMGDEAGRGDEVITVISLDRRI